MGYIMSTKQVFFGLFFAVVITYFIVGCGPIREFSNWPPFTGTNDFTYTPPKIDLPPGVVWPKDLKSVPDEEILV